MNLNTKIALMLGAAALIGGTGLALAQLDGPPPPDGPMQGLMHRERLSDRLLAEFDTNHDGKITHAEFNNVLGSRFAAATHGAKLMTPEQFWSIHQAESGRHAAAMFRRVDWNSDVRLSLEEFSAPQRAHFEMMDREGSGSVSCRPLQHAGYRPDQLRPGEARSGRGDFRRPGGRHGGSGTGGFGLARFCSEADLSRDGTVTRSEFDGVTAKEFSAATHGTTTMTLAQFTADQAERFQDRNARMFKRLDSNGDGKLGLAEFAEPPERMFDRLDRNRDGVITTDEMRPRFRGRERSPDNDGDN